MIFDFAGNRSYRMELVYFLKFAGEMYTMKLNVVKILVKKKLCGRKSSIYRTKFQSYLDKQGFTSVY